MKVLDLFGNETEVREKTKSRKSLFDDYDGFTDKFKAKLTTDDCYTPPEVYAVVLEWVRSRTDLTGKNIVRPFYPGGDYENEEYLPEDVVIDNPPFSILARILRFYKSRDIDQSRRGKTQSRRGKENCMESVGSGTHGGRKTGEQEQSLMTLIPAMNNLYSAP